MINILLDIYLLVIGTSIVFYGSVYYRKRGCDYVIKRIDFPPGLTGSEKYTYLENYIRTNRIDKIKNILFDLSNPEKEMHLEECDHVYLDYVV